MKPQKWLALVLLATITTWSVAQEQPRPFSATYEVHHSGARVGETTLSLSRSPDSRHWEFHSRTQPRGLAALIRRRDVVETSVFDIEDGHYLPRSYYFDEGSSKGQRNSRIDFDWTTGEAASEYKQRAATIELGAGMVDRLLIQLVIMRDIAAEALPTTYTVVDRNEVKIYELKVIGDEMLPTPAGQFDTVKVRRQRPGSSRATMIWAARDLNYLPVKMVQLKDDRPNAVLTVTDVQGLR